MSETICVVAGCGRTGVVCGPFDAMCEHHAREYTTRFDMYPRQEYVVSLKPGFIDERGSITNIVNCDIAHVAIITCVKGSVRAKHYHPPGNHQLMYLVQGSYIATSQEISDDGTLLPGTRRTKLVKAGDLAEAPSMMAHSYYFLEESVFLNLNTKARHVGGYGKHTIGIDLPAATKHEEYDTR